MIVNFIFKAFVAADHYLAVYDSSISVKYPVSYYDNLSKTLIIKLHSNRYPNLSGWLDKCSQEDFAKKANESGLAQFRGLLKLKLG